MTILVAMAKGTSRLVNIEVRDENGNPFDMTNGRAVFWVGKSPRSTGDDVIIMKDAPSITVDGSGVWTVGVTINPVDTESCPSRASYYCECRVWDQFDNEYVIIGGGFEIDPSLTLPAAKPP